MVEVEWSNEALLHLELITSYIAQFDRAAALRIGRRLVAAGESLAAFPHRGRPEKAGARALPLVPPYVILYEVTDERVRILRIRHSRQRPDW
jgi:plasmid stabilization system protein ParE